MPAYAFLSSPPQSNFPAHILAPPTPPKNKTKHKPHPITTTPPRCTPPRPRSSSHSRKRSISGGYSPSLIALTPNTPTPKTPHLTGHGYNIAFATYPRSYHSPKSPKRSPSSPKRLPGSPRRSPGSPKRSPSSPKRTSPRRRNHPSSIFAPPSPTKPKLSKIRSLTNLRSRPAPAPATVRPTTPGPVSAFAPKNQSKAKATPIMTTTSAKPSSKRAKRSATPARGSNAYTQYRPLPFIQQMHMIQFLEGGSMESIIRRHHVQAGGGVGAEGEGDGPVHGYAFMDERGMIWFDEEEEWEFACLLPKKETRKRGGMKKLWGKRREEEEWEEFVDEEVEEREEGMEDEENVADDLAAFGGMGRDVKGPMQSVLKLPKEKKRKDKRVVKTPPSAPKFPRRFSPTSLKQEFFASAFAPPPAPPTPLPQSTSTYRNVFKRKGAPSSNTRPTKDTRSSHTGVHSTPSASASSLPGSDVFDGCVRSSTEVFVRSSTSINSYTRSSASLAASNASTRSAASNSSASLMSHARAASAVPNTRTVSPPPAAARRLGIDPAVAVAVYGSSSCKGKKGGKKM